MANFFGKSKASSARASPAQESEAAAAGSSNQSAFEKTFKPFVVKKDAEVAPLNWFLDPKTNKLHRGTGRHRDVIVIDGDDAEVKEEIVDVKMKGVQEVLPSDVSQMNVKGWSF